ncbi:MAG: S-methyl-5-thioribose-1-phosphate isomerase [Pseudonocardiaceae bacterium]
MIRKPPSTGGHGTGGCSTEGVQRLMKTRLLNRLWAARDVLDGIDQDGRRVHPGMSDPGVISMAHENGTRRPHATVVAAGIAALLETERGSLDDYLFHQPHEEFEAAVTADFREQGVPAEIAGNLCVDSGTTSEEIVMERSVEWNAGAVVVIDQTALPHELTMLRLETVDDVIDAVARLAVQGVPALGLVGALGVALAATRHATMSTLERAAVHADAQRLAAARPTAVNLGWGVRRALSRLPEDPGAVLAEALEMLAEDEQVNRAVARRTADLVDELCGPGRVRILTHCNTGRLATAGLGTAVGAIRDLAAADRVEYVLVTETRPLLQGARLTAWELAEAGIPHRLCVDSAAPAAMVRGLVDCVLVGADRVAANGDVANKIGTYGLAVTAARHGIPFLVAAPESTVDETVPDGSAIMVEDRPDQEVTTYAGHPVAPAGTLTFNPAFDVTPAELITTVVTERRLLRTTTWNTFTPEPGRPLGPQRQHDDRDSGRPHASLLPRGRSKQGRGDRP